MTIFNVCRDTDCIVPGLYAMVSRLSLCGIGVVVDVVLE
jgi:hypothetical protein